MLSIVPRTNFITYIFVEKTTNIAENVDPALLSSMRDGMAGNLEGVPAR